MIVLLHVVRRCYLLSLCGITMRSKTKLLSIIETLEKIYVPWKWEIRDPFKILVSTILSQRTSWKNVRKAVDRLESKIGINPKNIAEANLENIKECIKVAGLYNAKSVRIKEIARIIVEKYDGDLSKVLNLPLEDARKELLSLPGVGFKTADVILLFAANKRVFPVDTHIMRISKRLGIVKGRFNYENIRHVWEKALPRDKYAVAHILLIIFGREICKSGKPLCDKCSIARFCKFYEKLKGGARGESSKERVAY